MGEDPADHPGILNGRDQAHAPSTVDHPLDEILRGRGARCHTDYPRALQPLRLDLTHVVDQVGLEASVELALWFHDLIYKPGASDNEDRSAQAFEAIARESRLSPGLIADVKSLILATRDHARSNDVDCQIMLDCDLAPLGYDREIFRRDSAALDREQSSLSGQSRHAALKSWADRERIFQTEIMWRRYERTARANLAWGLDPDPN